MGGGYTPTFGGSPVQPGHVSYKLYSFFGDISLEWPTGLQDTQFPATFFNDLNPQAPDQSVKLPDATQVSVGTAVIVNNISGSVLQINDFTGGSLAVVDPGIAKYMLLNDNTTPAGAWHVIQFGAGTSAANASALAGAGLQAIANLLSWAPTTLTLNTTPFTLSIGHRAQFVIWTGGAGVLNLPPVSQVGDRWLVMVNNAGSGTWTLEPDSAELIDNRSNISLNPGESCIVECQGGTAWYTVGRGRTLQTSPVAVLDKNIGGAGATITLTAGEAASQIQRFTSAPALTSDVSIVYGSASNFYFVDNSTTGGFVQTFKGLVGDAGVVVAQGTKAILVNKNGAMTLAVSLTSGTVTQINTSARLAGGPITTTGTLDLATSGVTPGNYASPAALAIDAYGRVTAVSAGNQTSPPIGTVIDFAGPTAPPMWLLCAGQAVSRVTYSALFAVIGTTYGVGDNSSTFNLPDCIGRAVVCRDYGYGRINGVVGDWLGAVGGNQYLQSHAHGVNDPTHYHPLADPGHTHGIGDPGHTHGVNDPTHQHTSVSAPNTQGGGAVGGNIGFWVSSSAGERPYNIVTTANGTGISIAAAGTGIYTGTAGTGAYANYAATGISIQAAGNGTGHNMPPVIAMNKLIFAGA